MSIYVIWICIELTPEEIYQMTNNEDNWTKWIAAQGLKDAEKSTEVTNVRLYGQGHYSLTQALTIIILRSCFHASFPSSNTWYYTVSKSGMKRSMVLLIWTSQIWRLWFCVLQPYIRAGNPKVGPVGCKLLCRANWPLLEMFNLSIAIVMIRTLQCWR